MENQEARVKSESLSTKYQPVVSPPNSPLNNNTQHLIAPTHSNIRLTPKKGGMEELTPHRPVLHKYPSERVEIVYHRKSGESETLGLKKTKSRKNTTPKSASKLHGVSEDRALKIRDKFDHNQLLEESFVEQDTTTNDSIVNHLNESSNGPNSVLAANSEVNFVEEPISLTSSASMTVSEKIDQVCLEHVAKEDDQQLTHNSEACREMFEQLWNLIEQMQLDILELHERVGSLESKMVNEVQVLKEQREKHLQSSKVISEDFRRMQNIISSHDWKGIEENVGHLLKRAKRCYTKCNSKTLEITNGQPNEKEIT